MAVVNPVRFFLWRRMELWRRTRKIFAVKTIRSFVRGKFLPPFGCEDFSVQILLLPNGFAETWEKILFCLME